MSDSAAHYLYNVNNPSKQTDPMRFGSLVHALVLGGSYAVYNGERRGNAWAEFAEQNDGKLTVVIKEFTRASAVAAGIRENLARMTVVIDGKIRPCTDLLIGETERELDFTFRGTPARSRIDVLGPGRIVDLKTTSDAHPRNFQWHGRKLYYHAQMAFYLENTSANFPEYENASTYLIAAEVDPPFVTTVHRYTDRAIRKGRMMCVAWHELLEGCRRSDNWPGYSQTVCEYDIADEGEDDDE
jgi:hypothetical protein